MSLQETPVANRLHIGFFGRCNSGKSTLINAFTSQEVTIVSSVAGTTTDVVQKNMELHGLGPCTLLDTAGFDDKSGELGQLRIDKTKHCAEKVDIAVIVFDSADLTEEAQWVSQFNALDTPIVGVVSKCDLRIPDEEWIKKVCELINGEVLCVNIHEQSDLEALRFSLIAANPVLEEPEITNGLVAAGDVVMLVMPQDIQAPKGRLILPQVQTIRELLDKQCVIVSVTPEQFEQALSNLTQPPKLIITDSQVFPFVAENKPIESALTSFSVLFAGQKGDVATYVEGVKAIDHLSENARIMIAELCSHAPLEEDIGRVKIPKLMRKRLGEGLTFDVVAGADFPDDLTGYDMIIQCGACVANRKLVQNRIAKAKKQQVPISNYGITMAYLNGILDKVCF